MSTTDKKFVELLVSHRMKMNGVQAWSEGCTEPLASYGMKNTCWRKCGSPGLFGRQTA
jgi:hypothetical protein